MDHYTERAAKARDTVKMAAETFPVLIREAISRSKVYSPGTTATKTSVKIPEIQLVDMDTVSAVLNFTSEGSKTAVLNFASYKTPGGLFLEGAMAQEEAICHESTLYNVISMFPDYYQENNLTKNRALYTNRAIYSPDIAFFRKVDDPSPIDSLKVKLCDVITCAAPNYTAASKYCRVSSKENHEVLQDRIRFILDIASINQVDTLILGAYGCGVFGQDPSEVAALFLEELNGYSFSNVVFAIPDGKNGNYQAFAKALR